MATISIPKELTPITINKFLGLNSAEESETQLQLGEASDMLNLRITDNYKLETIEGYKCLKEGEIDCFWQGNVPNTTGCLCRYNNSIYMIVVMLENQFMWAKISGDYVIDKCTYMEFDDGVYILDGNDYYFWSSEKQFAPVEGYVPLVAIGTPPAGGGTDYERINLLTRWRHQTFSADGTSDEFYIRDENGSIRKVYVNGVEQVLGTDWRRADGIVIFKNGAPAAGVDNVDVYWLADEDGSRELVTKNKYMTLYGTANDTRIFFYGNDEHRNRYYYTDIGDLKPRGDYIPATNFKDEGASNFAITGLIKHYDRLIVFKENETRYAIYEDLQTTNSTGDEITIPALKSYPLNSAIGNTAIGQVQLLDNYPVCINKKGIYLFNQTNVKAETNVNYLSQRIENELAQLPLYHVTDQIIMFDYEVRHELLISYFDTVYVYNYKNNTFSKMQLAHVPTGFSYSSVSNSLYFTCSEGIMKFDEKYTTFDGEPIVQKWESSYYNFEKDYKRKNVNRLYVSCRPFYNTNVDIHFSSDRGESKQIFNIRQNLFSFITMDFADYTFKYDFSIKPYRRKMKAKKFVFLKLKMFNDKIGTRFNIDSISFKYTIGGETK